ncbi:Multiple organellar RNA editing factor 8 like [Actinidia chinensis var. chinensis]|uniref:Multiple organellar RNA editing factor 8 like n=1 Tax=Actinidia chinensis var. chinensis TaxID=1590841 RepID=A0A2R6PTM3_ACTCC|nr:Multiple organellar RNA editing factor 8 like [Actinidia chinensis var. chinensis]
MATRFFFTRSLLTTKQTVSSKLCRSCTSLSLSSPPSSLSNSSLLHLSSLAASSSPTPTASLRRRLPLEDSRLVGRRRPSVIRSLTGQILPRRTRYYLDGCDFEHWIVMMDKPEGDPSRDELIDIYIKTLAMVVGRLYLMIPSTTRNG